MRKLILLLIVFTFFIEQTCFADSGSGLSISGSITSMPPGAPTLSNPTDGSTIFTEPVEVEWDPLDHAASFNLQVSTADNFSSLFLDESALTVTSHTITGLSGATTYYWKISATNMAGTGDFSTVWDFYTDAALSVELNAFSAEPVLQGVLVKWITQSETDNLGFILERTVGAGSNPPRDVRWQTIASYQTHDALIGQGNTSVRTDYAFTDVTVQAGAVYAYRLSDVNIKGVAHVYDVILLTLPETPDVTALDQPFPNPFNPQTKIGYHLSESGQVKITVYDLLGRKVKTLMDDFQGYGSYNFYWHGRDDAGNQMATGTYVIALQTADGVKTQKVLMMR
ncbi:T9SS type A sorting domain-containing protein [candidate division KSB1 bacterium]|nr:T9SS type A sorting domain-containing protein [candidate division KSB1 bacterium]